MNGSEMFRQTPQNKLGNRTNRWSNVQDARCPSFKKQFKQQRQQRRIQTTQYSTSESYCVCLYLHVLKYPKRNMKDSVKFRKRNFKNCPRTVHVLSNMQNVAFSGCCYGPFMNNGKEINKQPLHSLSLPLNFV